ncbi:MAG: hypothetical protein WDN04_10330 [Rhodospirillales bacterium]
MAMVLQTPEAIRTLQSKLYGKAKAEPDFRFYLLYDKVWRTDILRHAYERAHANAGAPGVDGITFDQIEAAGLEGWLIRLGEELRAKTYRCQPVRRVMIPKAAAASGHSASRRYGTGWCKPRQNWCWSRSSRRTWTLRHTAIGRGAARGRRSRRC